MTPGPWRWFNYPDGRKLLCGPTRAVIHCPDARISVDEADQCVIEAAPDLLIACKAALNDRMYKDWPGVADLLIAAIAKAEREDPKPIQGKPDALRDRIDHTV